MKSGSRRLLLASLALGVAACAGSPVIVATPSACNQVLPAEWEQGVAHAPTPPEAPPEPTSLQERLVHTLEQLRIWTGFAIDEANRVDMANGRYKDAVGIVRRCEVRDAAAVERSRPKFLGIF